MQGDCFFNQCVIRLNWMTHQINKYHNKRLLQYGITHGQSRILFFLTKERARMVTQRDIERQFSISASTVTSMLGTLEREGFITRKVDEADARVRRVELTDKGHGCEQVIHACASQTEERLLGVLDESERKTFIGLLDKLGDNVVTMSKEG